MKKALLILLMLTFLFLVACGSPGGGGGSGTAGETVKGGTMVFNISSWNNSKWN